MISILRVIILYILHYTVNYDLYIDISIKLWHEHCIFQLYNTCSCTYLSIYQGERKVRSCINIASTLPTPMTRLVSSSRPCQFSFFSVFNKYLVEWKGTFCRFSICNKITMGRMFMRRPSGQILVLASFVIMHHQATS